MRQDDLRAALEFDLADRLTKSMHVAGLTIPDMAEALDVSVSTVGNYTNGRTRPKKLALKEWAMRTGAPLEWLETGIFPENEKTPPMSGGRKMNSRPLDYKAAHSAEILMFPKKDTLRTDSTTDLTALSS